MTQEPLFDQTHELTPENAWEILYNWSGGYPVSRGNLSAYLRNQHKTSVKRRNDFSEECYKPLWVDDEIIIFPREDYPPEEIRKDRKALGNYIRKLKSLPSSYKEIARRIQKECNTNGQNGRGLRNNGQRHKLLQQYFDDEKVIRNRAYTIKYSGNDDPKIKDILGIHGAEYLVVDMTKQFDETLRFKEGHAVLGPIERQKDGSIIAPYIPRPGISTIEESMDHRFKTQGYLPFACKNAIKWQGGTNLKAITPIPGYCMLINADDSSEDDVVTRVIAFMEKEGVLECRSVDLAVFCGKNSAAIEFVDGWRTLAKISKGRLLYDENDHTVTIVQ